jgi:hypothetical protein
VRRALSALRLLSAKNKPLVRKAGARQRLAQVTVTWIVWYPVAPLGSVLCTTAVWV